METITSKISRYKLRMENEEGRQKGMCISQEYAVPSGYHPEADGLYRDDNAKGVLDYLLTRVRYRPDDPTFSLSDAVEFGLPHKSRYQVKDGDDVCNLYEGTKGYFMDEEAGRYVAFDNSDNECFVEEFDSPSAAENWLQGNTDHKE